MRYPYADKVKNNGIGYQQWQHLQVNITMKEVANKQQKYILCFCFFFQRKIVDVKYYYKEQ
ncbi:MAG: hypothetical protein PHH72_10535 [Parabacteroides sp.]|nr:hypothetical protein [Parabacteroides sp.]